MASLTDDILIDPLEENLADDPYGTAIWCMKNLIHRALNVYGGAMNETEHRTLVNLEESIRKADNA